MYEISVIKFYVRPVTMKSKVFPAFSSIRIEYREKLRISPHSVRIRENTGKMRTRITPNTDTLCLSVFSPNAGKCGKNADQNNSEYGHFFTQWWWNLVYCDYFISDDTTFKQNHVLLIAVCESLSKIVGFYIASFNWYDLILG